MYPTAADEATVAGELAAAAAFMQAGMKEEGRGLLTNIFVQHHSGVANAAGPEAVTEPLAELLKRQGVEQPAGNQLAIHDNLCEHKFRISPLAFFQVMGMTGQIDMQQSHMAHKRWCNYSRCIASAQGSIKQSPLIGGLGRVLRCSSCSICHGVVCKHIMQVVNGCTWVPLLLFCC